MPSGALVASPIQPHSHVCTEAVCLQQQGVQTGGLYNAGLPDRYAVIFSASASSCQMMAVHIQGRLTGNRPTSSGWCSWCSNGEGPLKQQAWVHTKACRSAQATTRTRSPEHTPCTHRLATACSHHPTPPLPRTFWLLLACQQRHCFRSSPQHATAGAWLRQASSLQLGSGRPHHYSLAQAGLITTAAMSSDT
jgi:hypothetical protein